ncbi:MAG: xylanase deacetylase [Thermobacillus sp.]|uniref:polysaccharide deacetylase family protein n=1 Tax=Thermobacillus sp. TaxID=2108467 RepID=UPI000E3A4A61|nr:polysaccharide deacetylase family protein [Thermobacillus sp.]REK59170.1 MAG: xylanase deacetylase [Thermobacillus sp.]
MRKPALALAAAMLLMTSCGQGTADSNGAEIQMDDAGLGNAGAADETVQPGAENAADSGAGESDESEDPGSSEGETGADGDEDTASAPAAPQYRMNGAYRFEPIDETAASKVVLLTFDDGPKDRAILEQMLDALDNHQAKAVFFVNGYRAVKQPELLELIHERGHMIGNHSWDHIDLKKENEETVRDQIGRVQQLVEETIGEAPKMFRPPFGSGGEYVRGIALEFGLLFTTWSNGSLDWDSSTKNKPDAVIQNVLDQLHPGANILMHELPWTAEALDELLGKIEEAGYGFLDPALIEIPDPDLTNGEGNGA